ncbi:MAG: TerC family protein [Rhodospirillales bacterium]|nr:MAG: TerC family protein [Rhodospirillales bacterium]
MEFLSGGFISALFAIVLIDLVLAGDNALVIGLVARDLPKEQQRKVILWGTFGAIAIRATMAIGVVWLLMIPGFLGAGGLALIWIARKLLEPAPETGDLHGAATPAKSLYAAIKTIVIADAVMGVDNVLAIGGAAHGSVLLIVLGLLISVPIIVWGSQIVIRLVDRFPSVILLGGVVLAWTAYGMIVREPMLKSAYEAQPALKFVTALAVFSLSVAPWLRGWLPARLRPLVVILPMMAIWVAGAAVVAGAMGHDARYLAADSPTAAMWQAVRWVGWIPFAIGWLWWTERRSVARGAGLKRAA